jgi:hypothetical protein
LKPKSGSPGWGCAARINVWNGRLISEDHDPWAATMICWVKTAKPWLNMSPNIRNGLISFKGTWQLLGMLLSATGFPMRKRIGTSGA